MILSSLEIMEKISRGCVGVNNMNGDFDFKRFTESQYEAYNINVRSVCPSGVCFDFCTDSEFVKLKYSVKNKVRDWMYFDIYVDNIFVYIEGQNPIANTEGEIRYNIPGEKGRMRRLTIYLPHLVEITLREIELGDNAHIEEVKPYEKSILCLGDSITQGMSALHPSSAYPVQLARHFGMNLLNHGVGGYVFNKNSLDETMQYSPDIITVAYGTNDWGVCKTVEEFSKNVKDYMDKLTGIYPNTKIFVVTPIWRSDIGETKAMGVFGCLGATIGRICSEYPQVQVIDGLTLVPHMPTYYGDATLHPGDEGFLHYAMGLLRIISNHI